jgi:hypothetical protein
LLNKCSITVTTKVKIKFKIQIKTHFPTNIENKKVGGSLKCKCTYLMSSLVLYSTFSWENFFSWLNIAFPPTRKKKREALHSVMGLTSHWLHGNSIPRIGYHYFWRGLTALPKNTLRIGVSLLLLLCITLRWNEVNEISTFFLALPTKARILCLDSL